MANQKSVQSQNSTKNQAQTRQEPLSRRGLLWLFFAIALALAPHIPHLPLWHGPLALVIFLWRYQVFRGAWEPPSKLMKFVMALAAIAGIVIEFRPPIGLEPMAALLIAGTLLKFVELFRMRDSAILHFMALFICALSGLFYQNLFAALYILIASVFILASLSVANRQDKEKVLGEPIKLNSKLFLQALPLAVVLFLVMPRLGALWSVPSLKHAAKTGVSDTMSPGDFSKLGKSADVAFRVSFEKGPIPMPYQRYWRGLVLTDFDGRIWTQSKGFILNTGKPKVQGESVEYSIILEPTQQRWLYAIPLAYSNDKGVEFGGHQTLVARTPVSSRMKYSVKSYLDYSWSNSASSETNSEAVQRFTSKDTNYLISSRTGKNYYRPSNPVELARATRIDQRFLALPSGFNPRTLEWAAKLQQEGYSTGQLVQQVLNHFTRSFRYTLEPPLLGKHSVDEFLFDTQAGFCEHFSSSFVFTMRALGVPARVVTGYQGGELNEANNYLTIRQYDAHAWAEVWFDNQGWVRVDPTAAVAPERIEQNLMDALQGEEGLLSETPLSLVRWKGVDWVNQVRLQWDELNYHWHRLVLGYDNEQKISLLKNLLGGTDPWRILLVMLASIFLPIGFISGWWYLKRSHSTLSPAAKLYVKFCKQLEKQGIVRAPNEAALAFAKRVTIERPELAGRINQVSEIFMQLEYGRAFVSSSENNTDQTSHKQKGQRYDSALKTLKRLI